jgi:hypothetical protein
MKFDDILKKLSISDFGALKEAEKKTYLAWAETLNRPDITIDDLKRILPAELDKADRELEKHETNGQKEAYYKAYASLCRFLMTVISGPANERKALEQMLKQRFKL